MRKSLLLLGIFALIMPFLFLGCSGDDGAQGPQGPAGPPGVAGQDGQDATTVASPLNLESCAICHDDQNVRNGDAHQADYDQRFQDNIVAVVPGSLSYGYNAADNSHNTSFQLTKNGLPFNCTQITTGAPADSLSIGFAEYNAATRTFDPPAPLEERLSLGSQTTLTYDAATNICTSKVFDNNALGQVGDLTAKNGVIEINGRDDRQGTLPSPSRVQLALFPFAGLTTTGTGVDYVSAANVTGCEKCHTVPYLKHGFIYGRVAGNAATDFYTCKGCHMDNARPGDPPAGGHLIWQLLVDNPQLAAAFEADESILTPAQEAQYAYRTRLMNDVHMSHAMEFAYPQSMSNCVTCHEGKLNSLVLTDNNFTIETCKSCHPVTGGTDTANAKGVFAVDTRAATFKGKQAPSLVGLLPIPGSIPQHNPPFATACNACHNATVGITPFSSIHTGFDKLVYGAAGSKFSTAITVTIDNAAFNPATNVLTWGFHATGTLGGLSSANIVPTVLVGLYGFDTKDFIVGPHESSPAVPSGPGRYLEAAFGTTHPRITITSPSAGVWNVSANLADWAALIADNVTRVEVGVMPRLGNADNVAVALNAPSKTFNIRTGKIEDGLKVGNAFAPGHDADFFGNSIARVPAGSVTGNVSGCNNCHEALGTTFHSADRGGNIVICRMCHITKAAGSHLELQSRSIDSYVHAIHRFQAFDTGAIDFTDPVEAMEYRHHVESNFPTFGIENCRACHNAGKFNVPNQGKSLPGVLSNTDFGTVRNINAIDNDFITGPATRACGACHRAEAIIANEGFGDPIKLANINSHMSTFGYMIKSPPPTIMEVINQVFASFGEGFFTPAP